MKRIICIVLILLGALMCSMSFVNDHVLRIIGNNTLESFNDLDISELRGNRNNANFYVEGIEELSVTRTLSDIKDIDEKSIIGQLIIPGIDLKLPVFKGLDNANLLAGVGTMKEGQVMGRGNFCLAGHYNKSEDTLFGGLMNVEIGSAIILTDREKVYEYSVFDTKVVGDTDVYMISDEEAVKRGKPIISLMTCYYSSKTGKRYFVTGELIDVYPYEKLKENLEI